MRVAYLINQYPKVSHSFIRREIRALEKQGLQVDRIAIRGWDADVVDAQDVEERQRTRYLLGNGLLPLLRAVMVAAVRRPRGFLRALATAIGMSVRSDRSLPYHLVYVAHACRILEWLQQSGASHLHAHFGTNSAEIAMLVRLLGGPEYSFTVHGPDEFDHATRLGLERKAAQAKLVVAISSYTRSQLFRWVGVDDWHKVKLVHCGLEPEFYASPATPPASTPRFVCVGRLCEQKGQLILLRALSQILAKGRGCQLVLAGDGEMRSHLEASIRELALEQHVQITGWVSGSRVREEILEARALVMPSFQEGLPVAIMEAMALRRPVISTYIAGIPELVIPGETGWLVPAGSVDELAAAMEDCLSTPADRLERMASAACSRAVERHDIDREAGKLANYFRQNGGGRAIEDWRS